MKTMGLLIIFSCSLAIGTLSSYKIKKSLAQLRGVLDFIGYIKSQIEYFNTPINDIYDSYAKNGGLLSDFILNISRYGWNTALEDTDRMYLSNDSVRCLKQFGSYLGKSNKEDQVSHCDYYIHLLENEYEKLEKEMPQKTKVSLALGLSGGIMLIILLI